MTNYEKYKDELLNYITNETDMVYNKETGKFVRCRDCNCRQCIFGIGDDCSIDETRDVTEVRDWFNSEAD